jgi:transcriptional regulator with XRE-family HTH domain
MHPQTMTVRTKKLGVLIYDARIANRRTQEECAKAIGVSPEVLRSFEAGEAAPSLPQLEVLAFYLDVPLSQFWSSQSLSENQPPQPDHAQLLTIRQRLIGAMLRQSRMAANLTAKDLAEKSGSSEDDLRAYEMGEKPVPLPMLEAFSACMGMRVEDFFDKSGPVGQWRKEQDAVGKFLDLPTSLQDFVCKPVNRPYVELALKLSELSVERLRAIAEGLLEITY